MNNDHLVATSSTMSSLNYRTQAKRLLENTFPRVSCKAIDAVFQACDYKFATAFRRISAIASDADDESKNGFDLIPTNVKVFIKSNRPKKHFDINDEHLLAEIDGIPELNRKVASTQGEKQKLYKYSCSLVRIPHGRVHMLCTYADENEDMLSVTNLIPMSTSGTPFRLLAPTDRQNIIIIGPDRVHPIDEIT